MDGFENVKMDRAALLLLGMGLGAFAYWLVSRFRKPLKVRVVVPSRVGISFEAYDEYFRKKIPYLVRYYK